MIEAQTARRSPEAVRDAADLLGRLQGVELTTATGRVNTILAVTPPNVLVATGRSPAGQPVPIDQVQAGLDLLREDGQVEISVPVLGHRSSFIGAVLLQLPDAMLVRTTPPQIRIADPVTSYRLQQAGDLNAWWEGDPAERYWLEITDRPDIGVDLHCPQRDASGARTPGYSLICAVAPGDIVFHYDKNKQAITAWSRAAGPVTEAPTVWLSHHAATRRRLLTARAQPGWWLDLEGPFPLENELTLAQMRDRTDDIRMVHDMLKAEVRDSLYFPFSWYGGTMLRPQQPYLNKLPAQFVALFPRLAAAGATARPPGPEATMQGVGTVYREATISDVPGERQPFAVDPALVERGLRGHADTQNALSRVLSSAGIEPRSPLPWEPNFDLAWLANGTIYVAEVKSITDENEQDQLRLGLGQVLWYRYRLECLGHHRVVAVLVPEREPRDPEWRELCTDLGVALIGGGRLELAAGLGTEPAARAHLDKT